MKPNLSFVATVTLLIFFLQCSIPGAAEQRACDSLRDMLKTAKDSNRVMILTQLSDVLFQDHPDSAYHLALLAMNEADKLDFRRGIIGSYSVMVKYLASRGFFDRALALQLKLLATIKLTGDTLEYANALIDHGNILQKKGGYEDATKYYLKAIHLLELIDNEYGISSVYRNLCIVQMGLGNYGKSKAYMYQAVQHIPDSTNQEDMEAWLMFKAETYNAMGSVFIRMNDLDSAMYCFRICENLYAKMPGSFTALANLYNNFAILYFYRNDKTESLASFRKALNYRMKANDKGPIAQSLNNIANFFLEVDNYDSCRYYAKKSLSTAKAGKTPPEMIDAYETLYTMYEEMGKYPEAFVHYQLFTTLKDSVAGEKSRQRISEMETVYETDKKEKEIRLLQQENQLRNLDMQKQQAELNRQRWLTASGIIGFVSVMIIALLIFNRYRLKQKSSKVLAAAYEKLEETNMIVTEKNKNITDSLKYARHIQLAVLPTKERLNKIADHALFYQPTGIVSGDFYYLNEVKDGFIIAVADCTGHGVPGAMISVLCFNALNHSINDCGLIEPSMVLGKCRELIIKTFEMSAREMREGMDIALCHISHEGGTPVMQYAGANNPLYVVPEHMTGFLTGNPDYDETEGLIEIRPNKQPIGKYVNHKPFHNHRIKLKKGDSVFLFSDGFADQFGGPQGKKFKYKRLKELIAQSRGSEMRDIESGLKTTFENWKGSFEQVDDVCVLGLRI